MSMHWGGIFAGVLLFLSGTYDLLTGEGGTYWGFPVPYWVGWMFLPTGIILFVSSFRALRRGDGKSPIYTEEDAKKAEAELDAMYLRNHGEPPEKPKTLEKNK